MNVNPGAHYFINIIKYGLLVITDDETIIIPDIFHIYS
jgi:hypothetical protein